MPKDAKQVAAKALSLDASPAREAAEDMVTLSKPRLRRPAGRHKPPPSCAPQYADDPSAAILAAVANIDPALWLQVQYTREMQHLD